MASKPAKAAKKSGKVKFALPLSHPMARAGRQIKDLTSNLGLLQGLSGTWVGNGFNLISLPDFDSTPPSDGPKSFRLLMNATHESLAFTPIGAPVPNRGSEMLGAPSKGQDDINLFGLRYLQQISDRNTHEPLHVEPGFWLNVPKTKIPAQAPSIVRQGSIPHGSSILVQGTAFMSKTGKPQFAVANTSPVKNPPGQLPLDYDQQFKDRPLPPPFTDRAIVKNPNLILANDIAGFVDNIKETVVLDISTVNAGGVLNIPFLENKTNNNAAATSVTATFWIETVVMPKGRVFYVLQYTQTVILNFLGIDWPHISVATLYLQ